MRFVTLWVSALLILAPRMVFAAGPRLVSAVLDASNRQQIVVTFDGSPSQDQLDSRGFWRVILATKTDVVQPEVSSTKVLFCSVSPVQNGACRGSEGVVQLALGLTTPAPRDVAGIEVIYRGPLGSAAKTFAGEAEGKGVLAGAKKGDADISFSGMYTKGAGADGEYDVDTFGGYVHRLGARAGALGVYGQAKTRSAPTLDPQSFLVYGVWQGVIGTGGFHGPVQSPFVNGRAGWEFDKNGAERNFVLSPTLTLPFRISGGTLGLVQPGVTTPHGTIHMGLEAVKPVETVLPDRDWRYRGLLGGTFVAGIERERRGFHSVIVTAAYDVRLLTDDEPFKDPTHSPVDPMTGKKGTPVFEFGHRARHHVEGRVEYYFVEWGGLSLTYEYGGLPPVFVLTDHTLTFGLTFSLKQTSYARYAILKP
jgi:hypothetical protein